MPKLPFKDTRSRDRRPLEIIHTDIVGPIKPKSHPNGNKFIIVFIDDYSRLAKAYPSGSKVEASDCFKEFLKSTRNLLRKNDKVCYLRSDQGIEFLGEKFEIILKREGIEAQLSPPYTLQYNDVSKSFNRTLQSKIRAYMFDSKLPKTMDFATLAAVHAYNRTPHKSIELQHPCKDLYRMLNAT